MTTRKELLVVRPGMHLKFKTPDGVKTGTVKQVDESTFPGRIVFDGDDGKTYDVPITIGWPD